MEARSIELESRKNELESQIALEKVQRPRLTKDTITVWLKHFRKLDMKNSKHRRRPVDSFVNAVILYDDRIELYFNYQGEAKTLTKNDLENFSDLLGFTPPCIESPENGLFSGLFLFPGIM